MRRGVSAGLMRPPGRIPARPSPAPATTRAGRPTLRRGAPLALCLAAVACGDSGAGGGSGARREPAPTTLDALRDDLTARIASSGAEVGLYYRSLGEPADSLAIAADLRMHAASTMKVPVMLQLFLDREAGRRSLDDSLEITRTFRSIVDGSPFTLDPSSDSDSALYARAGERVPVRELVERSIVRSSNLATNLLMETVDPERVTATLRRLGADSMEVLRGVEDLKAFEAGLSNTATARDLGVVMAAVAAGPGVDEAARREMLSILDRQHFRENIPAGLPPGTRVANKTGWITRHNHDMAVVFPPHAPPYVLAVMVRGIEEREAAAALVAELSRSVWRFHTGRRGERG